MGSKVLFCCPIHLIPHFQIVCSSRLPHTSCYVIALSLLRGLLSVLACNSEGAGNPGHLWHHLIILINAWMTLKDQLSGNTTFKSQPNKSPVYVPVAGRVGHAIAHWTRRPFLTQKHSDGNRVPAVYTVVSLREVDPYHLQGSLLTAERLPKDHGS